jgi:hypothetical protein
MLTENYNDKTPVRLFTTFRRHPKVRCSARAMCDVWCVCRAGCGVRTADDDLANARGTPCAARLSRRRGAPRLTGAASGSGEAVDLAGVCVCVCVCVRDNRVRVIARALTPTRTASVGVCARGARARQSAAVRQLVGSQHGACGPHSPGVRSHCRVRAQVAEAHLCVRKWRRLSPTDALELFDGTYSDPVSKLPVCLNLED